MPLDMSGLIAEVTRQTTVKEGVLAIIAKLKANAGDPVALQAAVQQIIANNDALATAVTENTDAA